MMNRAIAVILGGALVASATVASAQTPDAAKVAAGKSVFEETKCTKCHGPDGKGDKNGKLSLVEGTSKLTEAQVRSWITDPAGQTAKLPKKPKEPMKKFDLTPAQVDSLVAFVESLRKK
jgi:mono/diheme cytochrome c family protein